MDANELKQQIAGIEEEINALPHGSISTKKSTATCTIIIAGTRGKRKKTGS